MMLANRWWTHLWQRRYIPIHQQDVGGVLGLTWWCSWCASRKCWWADINRPLRRCFQGFQRLAHTASVFNLFGAVEQAPGNVLPPPPLRKISCVKWCHNMSQPWQLCQTPRSQPATGSKSLDFLLFLKSFSLVLRSAPRAHGLTLESTVQNEGCPYNDRSPCRTSRERRCQILEHKCVSNCHV